MTNSVRYKFFFFSSFLFLAFFLVFLPVLWLEVGFSLRELAIGSMMGTLSAIFSAPLAHQLAFKRFAASKMIFPLMVFGYISFSAHLFDLSSSVLIFFWLLSSLCGRAVYSLVEAQAIRDSEEKVKNQFSFEEIRVWGSVGFIVSTLITGSLMDSLSSKELVIIGMIFLGLNYLAAYLCKPLLNNKPGSLVYVKELPGSCENLPVTSFLSKNKENFESLGKGFKGFFKRESYLLQIACLYFINFLLWASHTPLYVYLSVYLKELGWSGAMISVAWNIGVVAEIILIAIFPKIEKYISLENLLRMTILFTTFRWLIMANHTNVSFILIAQVLHLFTFGVCYLASIKLVFRILPDDFKDRGQGLLASFGTGFGSFTGRVLVSYFAATEGARVDEIQLMFFYAAAASVIAFPVSLVLRKSPKIT